MVLQLLIKYLTKYLIIFLQQMYASAAQNSSAVVHMDQDGYDTVKSEPGTGTLSQAETVVNAFKVMTNIRVQHAIFKYHCICIMYVFFFCYR